MSIRRRMIQKGKDICMANCGMNCCEQPCNCCDCYKCCRKMRGGDDGDV